MSIRIIAQTNIFSNERLEREYTEGVDLDRILKDLGINPDTHLVYIMINDSVVKSITEEVKDGDLVLIKIIPTGDNPVQQLGAFVDSIPTALQGAGTAIGDALYNNDFANSITTGNGEWNLLLGTIATSVGSALLSMPLGVFYGGALMYVGGALLNNGYLNNTESNSSEPTVPYLNNTAYMKGGKTKVNPDGNIPVILGKHRFYPPMVAVPVINISSPLITDNTRSSTASNYGVYQQALYLGGHKDVEIDFSSLKYGEQSLPSGSYYSDTSTNQYGDRAKFYVNVNTRFSPITSTDAPSAEILLPKGVLRFAIQFAFGEFYSMDIYGKRRTPRIAYRLKVYEVVDGVDTLKTTFSEKIIIGGDVTKNATLVPTYSSVYYETMPIYTFVEGVGVVLENIPFDPTKEYKLVLSRRFDNPMEKWEGYENLYNPTIKAYKNECTILGVNGYFTEKPSLSDYALNNYRYLALSSKLVEDTPAEDFNFIAQTKYRIWDGVTSGASGWNNTALTNNPASMYLYILQGRPNSQTVPNDEIDWQVLEEWYTFCETGVVGVGAYQCNMVLDTTSPIETLLKMICGTGRATFNYDGTYSLIIDKPRPYAKQLITPKNSYGFAMYRNLTQDFHGITYNFIDEDAGYTANSLTCYADGYNKDGSEGKLPATKLLTESIVGVTNGNILKSLGTFNVWLRTRRIESVTVNMDWEYILCKQGDLVKVQHDVPLLGLVSARIMSVVNSTTYQVEESIPYEIGKNYSITVRKADTTQITGTIINQEAPSRTVETTLELLGLAEGDLVSVFETGTNLGEYLVADIQHKDDLTATIKMVNYAPEIYTSGDALPPFVSNVYKPANFGQEAVLTQGFDTSDVFSNATNTGVNVDNVIDSGDRDAIQVGEIPAILLNDTTIEATEIGLSNDYYYFVDADNLHLYRSIILPNAPIEEVIDSPIRGFDVLENDSLICYTSLTDGNCLYIYDGETHIKITEYPVSQPHFWEDNVIMYVADGKLYYVDINDTSNPVLFMDDIVANYDYNLGFVGFKSNEDSSLWVKSIDNDDPLDKGISVDTDINFSQIKLADSDRVSTPYDIYYRDSETLQSYKNGFPYRSNVVKHAVRVDGSYLYISNEKKMFIAEIRSEEAQQRRLEVSTETTSSTIEGYVTAVGDRRIKGVSNNDLDKVVRGDYIVSPVFPDKTKVLDIGAGEISVDKGALYAYSQGVIGVEGTRLLLNANRVVVPGTITAGLVETNFLNSTARVPEGVPNAGEPLYQHDMAEGTELQFGTDGKLLRTFSAENGLWLSDGVTVGGTSPDAPRTTIENAKFTDTVFTLFVELSTTTITGMQENDQWYQTDTGLTKAYKNGSWVDSSYTKEQLDALGINAGLVNGHTVEINVPADALFTDTTSAHTDFATPPSSPNTGDTWTATVSGTSPFTFWRRHTYKYDGVSWNNLIGADLEVFEQNSLPTTQTKGDQLIVTETFTAGSPSKDYYKGSSYVYTGTEWLYVADNTQKIFADTTIDLTRGDTGVPGEVKFGLDGAGNLTARDALIYGTVYAEAGEFSGTVIAGTGTDRHIEIANNKIEFKNNTAILSTFESALYNGMEVVKAPQDLLMSTMIIGRGKGGVETNVVIGVEALHSNTTGNRNVAIGESALHSNTTGYRNVALGVEALNSNTTGYRNVATGIFALGSNIDGHSNVAIGTEALGMNTTGDNNVCLGTVSGLSISTGSNNICIGTFSGEDITTGSNNIFLGGGLTYLSGATSDHMELGNITTKTTTIRGSVSIGKGLKRRALYGNTDSNTIMLWSTVFSTIAGIVPYTSQDRPSIFTPMEVLVKYFADEQLYSAWFWWSNSTTLVVSVVGVSTFITNASVGNSWFMAIFG